MRIEYADQREVKRPPLSSSHQTKVCAVPSRQRGQAARRVIEERYSHLPATAVNLMFIGKKGYDVYKRSNYTC